MKEPTYCCPECESDKVTAEHQQMFMVNTGNHYCHSMKIQDPDSPATCLDCGWEGVRENLTEKSTC
jgi:predicted Zn-ribbon and HTH transcriptional regulator